MMGRYILRHNMRFLPIVLIHLFWFSNLRGQASDSSLKISRLTGDFYVYTTFNLYRGARIPANGLYLVTRDGVVMIDSPWDTTQFQPLLDSIKARHHADVVLCIATHFHEDRTAGLEYYRRQSIKTYTSAKTDQLSKESGKKRAEFLFYKDTVFNVGQYSFQTYFPGQGHTSDNIVIWFAKEKILYGGCLVKTVNDTDLGYTADGNLKAYASTIRNLQQKCQSPKFVIPGHGEIEGPEALRHTLEMAMQNEKK